MALKNRSGRTLRPCPEQACRRPAAQVHRQVWGEWLQAYPRQLNIMFRVCRTAATARRAWGHDMRGLFYGISGRGIDQCARALTIQVREWTRRVVYRGGFL